MTLEIGQQRILTRAEHIINAARNRAEANEGGDDRSVIWRLEEINLVIGYAEPGYGCTDSIIAFGNWNPIGGFSDDGPEEGSTDIRDLPRRVGDLLEKAGVSIKWNDEWATCGGCYKAVRTQADSYGWTRSYTESEDGDISCEDCTLEDPTEYLEGLEGDSNKAITLAIDPTAHGYLLIPEQFENGLYGGQSASPNLIAEGLEEMDITRYVFNIDSVGQFDAKFSVYVHEDDIPEEIPGDHQQIGEIIAEILREHGTDGFDPAEGMKKALASIPSVTAPASHVVYSKVDASTGTAETHIVPQQAFIDGNLP